MVRILEAVREPIRMKTRRMGTLLVKLILLCIVIVPGAVYSNLLHSPDSNEKEVTALPIAFYQQDQTVTGIISDSEGVPLAGASILEKGTSNGTQSDFDGNFTLDLTDGNAVLVASYVGFATEEIPVNGQSTINITLQESAEGLEEVVVIGYGTVKKSDLTGSVSSIQAEKVEYRFPSIR